jgi:hypothetical protein
MGLNLLSQPAQAISVGFSFANLNGNILPTGADQLLTGTIDGLVEGNNSGQGVTATVLSIPNSGNSQLLGGYNFYSGSFTPDDIIVTAGNITLLKGQFFQPSAGVGGLVLLTAGVNISFPNGTSRLIDYSPTAIRLFADDSQPATFTATAVPWETDALPVIGSTVLFGLGLWAKSKFAKPLQK